MTFSSNQNLQLAWNYAMSKVLQVYQLDEVNVYTKYHNHNAQGPNTVNCNQFIIVTSGLFC